MMCCTKAAYGEFLMYKADGSGAARVSVRRTSGLAGDGGVVDGGGGVLSVICPQVHAHRVDVQQARVQVDVWLQQGYTAVGMSAHGATKHKQLVRRPC